MAYNSSDLRVRAASVEVSLAAYGIEKTADNADHFIRLLEEDQVDRPYRLWVLGLLANRGVEPERIFRTLERYLDDPDEGTRKWAVDSLAMLGNDETIPLLLDVFRFEPSLAVKERAACSLAESGMLTREQRQRAAPEFLRFMDDPALEPEARRWSFQALRDITGQSIGDDSSSWRNWAVSEGYL